MNTGSMTPNDVHALIEKERERERETERESEIKKVKEVSKSKRSKENITDYQLTDRYLPNGQLLIKIHGRIWPILSQFIFN